MPMTPEVQELDGGGPGEGEVPHWTLVTHLHLPVNKASCHPFWDLPLTDLSRLGLQRKSVVHN